MFDFIQCIRGKQIVSACIFCYLCKHGGGYRCCLLRLLSDIDFLALDKGEISAAQVVSQLKETMEEYANYGFSVMKDKMDQNENYFYNNTAFLNMFLSYSKPQDDSEEVESLD